MWLHFLKMAVRAAFADRFFGLVNLFGLAVGLASVTLIFLYVDNEFGYDRWLPRHQTLYRLETIETAPGQTPIELATAPGPLKAALPKDFPQVVGVARAYATPATVIRAGQPFSEDLLVADANFFTMLGLPFQAGPPEQALGGTGSVALSARAAEKYFGRGGAVGQRLTLLLPEPRDFIVSSVFETLPSNSHMNFDVVIPFAGYFGANQAEIMAIPDAWNGAYFHTYVRLRDSADAGAVERALPAFVQRNLPDWLSELTKTSPHAFYRFRLVPVSQAHFDGAATAAMKPPASRAAVLGIAAVALLILLIASINFANLTTARSILRAREVAVRKVVGAKRRQILLQFLGEALFVTACAGLVALALVELALPSARGLLGLQDSALEPGQWRLGAGLAALVLLTAFGSGLYPSVIVSRVLPAAVFNRDFQLRGGGRVRSLLVIFQFAISIALIAATLVMLLQSRFTLEASLGFDKENVLILRVPEGPRRAQVADALAQAVARHRDVASVSLSSAVPSDLSEDNIALQLPGEAKPAVIGFHRVDSNFFRTYRVTPLAGRTASTRQSADGSAAAVVNAAALERLGISDPAAAVGAVFRGADSAYTIIGIVPDLHFRSLHEPVREEMYVLGDQPGGALSIRYRGGDATDLLGAVDAAWARLMPDRAVDRAFLDENLAALYERERRQAALLSLFAAVAIILSCLGLLAMAAFSAQRRAREIAVRKVLGARTRDIARLLLWDFARPVLLANLLAWPVAWWAMREWLNRFAYRIDLPWLAFAAAGLLALLIAFATVAAQTFKVARANPARALQHD